MNKWKIWNTIQRIGRLFIMLVMFILLGITGLTLPATADINIDKAIAQSSKSFKLNNPCEVTPSANLLEVSNGPGEMYEGSIYQPFQNPKEIKVNKNSNELMATLTVDYGTNSIAGCPVTLRSYNGDLVGPTLRIKQKSKMKIQLINNLPPNPDNQNTDENVPHDFNTTNFHVHGLHVSPKGISDNVMIKMPPKATEDANPPQYDIEVQLPEKHPGGTDWYHPHVHGSTAIQVASGMVGALIVEGGLDEIPAIASAQEKIMVFQQIDYGNNGRIDDYKNFGVKSGNQKLTLHQSLNRYTTINGQVVPTISMQPGEVQHWRLIHAGVSESIHLQLVKKDELVRGIVPLREIAVDGLPLGKMDNWEKLKLEPGYRSDVLVKAPLEAGQIYELIDAASDPEESLQDVKEQMHILAKIKIEGSLNDMPLPKDSELAEVRKNEVHENIPTDGNYPVQQVVFSVECRGDNLGCIYRVDNNPDDNNYENYKDPINGKPYNHNSPARELKLGTTEKWILTTLDPPTPQNYLLSRTHPRHPFHIHVNPFQHIRTGPDGKPETIWRDTLGVPFGEPQTIWTSYEDFTGEFVFHCHILHHEDKGMMERVKICSNNKQFPMEDSCSKTTNET